MGNVYTEGHTQMTYYQERARREQREARLQAIGAVLLVIAFVAIPIAGFVAVVAQSPDPCRLLWGKSHNLISEAFCPVKR